MTLKLPAISELPQLKNRPFGKVAIAGDPLSEKDGRQPSATASTNTIPFSLERFAHAESKSWSLSARKKEWETIAKLGAKLASEASTPDSKTESIEDPDPWSTGPREKPRPQVDIFFSNLISIEDRPTSFSPEASPHPSVQTLGFYNYLRTCICKHFGQEKRLSEAKQKIGRLSSPQLALLHPWASSPFSQELAAQSIRPNNKKSQAFEQLADLYQFEKRDFLRSRQFLRIAETYAPRKFSLKLKLAQLETSLGSEKEAERILEEALALKPGKQPCIQTLRQLARLHQGSCFNPRRAIDEYQQLLALQPDDHTSRWSLIQLLRSQNPKTSSPPPLSTTPAQTPRQLDESLRRLLIGELLNLADAIDPGPGLLSFLWNEAAETLYEHGDLSQAESLYEALLDLHPGYTPALQRLASIYHSQNRYEDLLRLCSAELDPYDYEPRLHYRAARILLDRLNQPESALQRLQEAYQLDCTFVPTRELLIELAKKHGRHELAYATLQTCEAPSSPTLQTDLQFQLAELAVTIATKDEASSNKGSQQQNTYYNYALQHYRQCLQESPSHLPSFEGARRLLTRFGDTENLIALLQHGIENFEGELKNYLRLSLARTGNLQTSSNPEKYRLQYESLLQERGDDALLQREYENFLRRNELFDTLPAVCLQAAENSSDVQHKAALLIEAAELLHDSPRQEDRDLAASSILQALQIDPGNAYAVRHLEDLISDTLSDRITVQIVGARAIRAQSEAEQAIFYLESARLLEQSQSFAHAKRAYAAALNAVGDLVPAQQGLERISALEKREQPKTAKLSVDEGPGTNAVSTSDSTRRSLHELLAEMRLAASQFRLGNSGSKESASTHAFLVKRIETSIRSVLEQHPSQRDALALARAMATQSTNKGWDPQPFVRLIGQAFPNITDPGIRYELALTLAESSDSNAQAIDHYELASSLRPQGKRALRGLSKLYRQEGRERDAILVTERLIDLYDSTEPAAIDLRFAVATQLAPYEDTQERALEHLRIILKHRPDDHKCRSLMADLLEKLGRNEEAAKQLKIILEQTQEGDRRFDLHKRIAGLLQTTQKKDAIFHAESAIELHPGARTQIAPLVQILRDQAQDDRIANHLPAIRKAFTQRFLKHEINLPDLRFLQNLHHPSDSSRVEIAESLDLALGNKTGALPKKNGASSSPRQSLIEQTPTKQNLRKLLRSTESRRKLLPRIEIESLDALLVALDPLLDQLPGFEQELPKRTQANLRLEPAIAQQIQATIDRCCKIAGQRFPELEWNPKRTLEGHLDSDNKAKNSANLLAHFLEGRPNRLMLPTNYTGIAQLEGHIYLAFARQLWGAPRARSLSAKSLDLLLAACFEVTKVFNPLLADPDTEALAKIVPALDHRLKRKHRRILESSCASLATVELGAGQVAQALRETDLRLACLLSPDIGSILDVAFQIDQRDPLSTGKRRSQPPPLPSSEDNFKANSRGREIQRSPSGCSLVAFLFDDSYIQLKRSLC